MGKSSQYAQEREQEDELIDQLETIKDEFYDDTAQGIIRQIIGTRSLNLSKKQQYIFDNIIEPYRSSRFVECQSCSQVVDSNLVENLTAVGLTNEDVFICFNCKNRHISD